LGGPNAAQFNVGEVNYTSVQEGAILSQTFTASAGLLNLSFDYATLGNASNGNYEGGVYTLLLDGVGLVSFSTGFINPSQLVNGTLSTSTITSAGVHTFGIEITRPYISAIGTTPEQFVTNAVASQGTSTPEPASMLLLGSGILAAANKLRKRA
jgi:hypothetical protein